MGGEEGWPPSPHPKPPSATSLSGGSFSTFLATVRPFQPEPEIMPSVITVHGSFFKKQKPKEKQLMSGFVWVFKNLEIPGILLWHFQRSGPRKIRKSC